ncbi:HAMP domain-containing histidine kinase [Sporosarcina sp. Marseille-Q4063]|uniref:sensor histidine kinase n=1 Tax=Sporosarcina sp. Marseille-Q4063 TaxID=2810514 RepID=UPI001BAEA29A|nr:HAMP domain-containing sensor histidine kinase [Sporosarcina sp. Marseille-Q4063]QUW21948.1 HAMP domain-containing histidine kinase [Sporosarcina sp. Marseille-Q4063]
MWGWIVVFIALALLLYIYFLKREMRKLKHEIKEIPTRASFGSRLSLDLRDKALMDLVDELNQMIDAFEGKNRQAKQMEENVKLSIAGLSHDLRTPLTSINGYVQLLNETTDETKRIHYLRIIEHAVKRLMEMTDHFYDLARIETNQKETVLSSISLSNLVEETFLSFYEQFEEKNIQLQFPEQINGSQIIADQFMLIRVIQNVVQNILRYAKSKAVINYRNEGDYLIFSIKNDIKPDSKIAVEKVFMRFYTEVTSRTNTEASGLGLYLSKKLVEKMEGKMDAELNGNWFILKIQLPIGSNKEG